MGKCILLIGFLLLINDQAKGQQKPMKLGEVSLEDVTMTSYAPDPEASAVILYDYGKIYFRLDFVGTPQAVYERHCAVKILKKTGYEFANIDIPFLRPKGTSRKEKVTNIEGITYNLENGAIKKTVLDKSAKFKEEADKNYTVVKLAMPDVKEGAVIEYSYQITSDFFYQIRTWEFENELPMQRAIFEFVEPIFLDFEIVGQNCGAFKVKEKTEKQYGKKSEKLHRWEKENVPAYQKEDFVNNVSDHLCKLDFHFTKINLPNIRSGDYSTLHNSWGNFVSAKFFWFDDDPDELDSLAQIVAPIIKGKTDRKAQMIAIYDFLRKKLKPEGSGNIWDNAYNARSTGEILSSGEATAYEINSTLMNLLRGAKIFAFPVLLSTRAHGKINKDYPSSRNFNYFVVYASCDTSLQTNFTGYLLDATDSMRMAGMLPAKAMNGEGLLMFSKSVYTFIPLQDGYKTSKVLAVYASLGLDGKIKGEVNSSTQGYAALDLRKEIKAARDEEDSVLINKTFRFNEFQSLKATHENVDDYEKPLKSKMEFADQAFAEASETNIYFNPMLFFQLKENPLKQGARKYPLDFVYTVDDAYHATIQIPQGFMIEEVPKSMRIQWEDKSVRYDYLIQSLPDKIQITSKLSINRAVFEPEEYVGLRDFFAKIVAKQNEQIVLKKK
jgi:Domain of Unknown Function with PDB structure (DUF3857)